MLSPFLNQWDLQSHVRGKNSKRNSYLCLLGIRKKEKYIKNVVDCGCSHVRFCW